MIVRMNIILLITLSCATLVCCALLGLTWYRFRYVTGWIDNTFVTTVINNTPFSLEVASSALTKARGLSGRSSLAEKTGMLFVFAYPQRLSFWMSGMFFDLDFVWIKNNTIVGLNQGVLSPNNNNGIIARVSPTVACDKVIELPVGSISRYDLKIGQNVLFNRE